MMQLPAKGIFFFKVTIHFDKYDIMIKYRINDFFQSLSI